MKKSKIFLLITLMFNLATNIGFSQTAREVAKKTFPSTVMLIMEDAKGQPKSLGSGFFIKEDIIATNMHVVEGSSGGYAKIIGQKTKFNIEGVVGIDEKRDLILLKVSGIKSQTLTLGDDTKMAAGDTVYAVGNPEGLEGTFSQGIISGIRQIENDKLLQITAPISPGSSGGPVLNSSGEVVGVAVSTYREGQNLNFAVPVSYLQSLLTNIKTVSPLSTIIQSRSARSITENSGTTSSEGVIAINFKWNSEKDRYSGYPSAYTFTLRNKLRDSVTNILYVVIFYGDDGEPIHSELMRYTKPILGSLAKTLNSDPSSGRDAPYPGHEIRKLTSRTEVRVLDFQIIRE